MSLIFKSPELKGNELFRSNVHSLSLEDQIKFIQSQRSLIPHRNYFRRNSPDLQYLEVMEKILLDGEHKTRGRNKETTISIFSSYMKFNLQQYFPLLTSKKVFIRGVFEELMWMLRGQTDVRILQNKNVRIWDGNMLEDGTIGNGYGYQWRHDVIDQIEKIRFDLKNDPDSRRHIVSAWNVSQLDKMALPPCHALFQFYVSNDNKLSCQLYQRSADMFLGVPFNIAFYAILTHLLAADVGLEVGDLFWVGGDCHIYDNLINQSLLQMSRTPLDSPQFEIINKRESIYDYEFSDIKIIDYVSHDKIEGQMAI